MIKASGFRTIPDLFRMVPGMYVSYYSGNSAIVGYHGVIEDYARRMQMLVDGRTVYMPPMGGVSWEDLPLQMEDIERIEVTRGPAAASYGGNSYQGVINIITRDAGALRGLKASATKGNGGISDSSLNFGNRGETLDYRMSFGYRSDNGYDANQVDPNNDSHSTHLFNLRAGYHPNAVNSIDLQMGYNKGSRGVGSVNSWPDLPHDTHNTEDFQQATWLHSLDGGSELKLQFYHIYHDELNTLGWISDNVTVTRDEVELQHTLVTSRDNRLVWGASVRKDWTNAPNRFLTEQTVHESALFAHDEWRFTPQWILNVGTMLEDSGLGQKSMSPRAALNYHFAEQQTLRVGISRAYRNPSLFEERSNYHFLLPGNTPLVVNQSSGGLRPEGILSREIGYLGEFSDKALSIDARMYYDKLSDIIYLAVTLPPQDYVNTFNAEHRGLEITTKSHWSEYDQLMVNYSYQVFTGNYVSYGNNESYSSTMPRNMISALYSRNFADGIECSIGYYQQSTLLTIDRPSYDRQQFTRRVDARIAKKFKLDDEEGDIALVVQDPLTNNYIDYRVRNQFSRRAFVTATIAY
jgi:iron complex outermembrane receptor protein